MTTDQRPIPARPGSARVLSTIYALATLTALLLVLFARSRGPSSIEELFGLANVPVAPSVLSVVVLALAARALMARKRFGLATAAFFQVSGIAVGILAFFPRTSLGWLDLWQSRSAFGRALDIAAIATGVVALAWLWSMRGEFTGRLRIRRAGAAAVTLVVGTLLSVGATAGMVELAEEDGARLSTVVRAVLSALGGGAGHHEVSAPWVVRVTEILAALVLVASVAVLLKAPRAQGAWDQNHEVALRGLLRRHGGEDSLGYMATRRDKDAVFSADGSAALTYRVVAGVSLASADPIGNREGWGAVIGAWLAQAREHGWTPAVISASERGAAAYASAGLLVGRLGDEAILEPERWDVSRAEMQGVVRAARHARRGGLVVSMSRQEDMSQAEITEVIDAAERWRGGEPDRGFSMALNRLGDAADGSILHVMARDPHGALMGVLSFVPWGTGGLSLDLMRRSPEAPNGVVELLVSELMARARSLGVRRVSLNFCMFRDTFHEAEQVAAGSYVRGLAAILGQLDRFWQLERLYLFNRRFLPRWVPRFYCYDDPAALPQVAFAAGRAEGFISIPGRDKPSSARTLDAVHLEKVRALDLAPEFDAAVQVRQTRQERDRRRRLTTMMEAGVDPYPVGIGEPADTLAELAAWTVPGSTVELTVRARAIRDHGAVVFVTVEDAGDTAQALLESARTARFQEFRRFVQVGDVVRLTGAMGISRTGTPSLLVSQWRLEAKALRPVPFSSLESPQARLRDRSADLLVHPETAELLRNRSAVVASLRRVLMDDGYLEVDTPALQAVHGGATARPFETWSNAYGQPLSLRIAPELYLKRLLVGGMGPLFEIARNFRNEGADATHNPEFTALEAYRPHGDYTTMRLLTERLIREAATAVHGSAMVPMPTPDQVRRGLAGIEMVDISGPWAVVSVLDAVSQVLGRRVDLHTDLGELSALARERGVRLPPRAGAGEIVEELYGELVEPVTMAPTFYTDFPAATSPLTRPHRSEPGLVERWDLVVAGMEVATAYSELTDPVDQRARLTEQSLKAAAGDVEAMEIDEDFLRALELGMPPAGGLGVGVDRLVMLLTNTSIRSVLAFPFVRPETSVRDT